MRYFRLLMRLTYHLQEVHLINREGPVLWTVRYPELPLAQMLSGHNFLSLDGMLRFGYRVRKAGYNLNTHGPPA